jgi:hypothetical protein
MAQDTQIPQPAPGIASFATESFGGPTELRFGDGQATTTTVGVGASLDLKIGTVVSYDGTTIALADQVADDAYGILTTDVVTGVGESTTIDVYRSGHFDMDALTWDASFTTDAQKKVAFEGSLSPTIFVSKKKFNDDAIDV